MMTIQKPKRQFQKKKSYLKRKLLKKFEGGKDQMSYKDWLQKAVIYKGIDDLKGYDYEGWYNEDPKRAYAFLNDDPEAHFDDKYKTVYHPTFSDQLKKANKGKFTETANRHNMGVQEFANKVLNAPEGKYSSTLRKRANFARNFAH